MKAIEKVDALVRKPIEELGFELDEIEFKKEHGNWVLTLYIDKEGGVSLLDCENVSRLVDPILDEADPIEQAYYLSVSSIGLDRPLKKDRDFERNMGKSIVVKLYAPIDKKKEFVGLSGFDENSFTFEDKGGGMITILRRDAASVKPYIDFK